MPWTSDRLWGLSNVELSLNPPNVTPVKMKQKLAIGVLIFSSQNRQVSKESSKGSRDGFLIFAATVAGVRNSRSPLPLLPCWEVAQSHLIQNLLCIRWNRCTDKKTPRWSAIVTMVQCFKNKALCRRGSMAVLQSRWVWQEMRYIATKSWSFW